jgi:glycosyltransferase involved in cell wall biosynthesis
MIPLKGTALLLHTVRYLLEKNRAVELYLAGVGPEREKLELLARKLSIESKVHFLGLITNVKTFYDSIDLLLIPSIREPLGLVALESQARGVPCLTANVDGLPEVVSDGKNGFCITPTLSISQYESFGGTRKNLPDCVYNPASDSLSPPQLLDPRHIAEKIELILSNPDLYTFFSQEAIASLKKRSNFTCYRDTLDGILKRW